MRNLRPDVVYNGGHILMYDAMVLPTLYAHGELVSTACAAGARRACAVAVMNLRMIARRPTTVTASVAVTRRRP